MAEDLRIEEVVVAVHVLRDDLQQVVAVAGYRITLHDLRQLRHVPLETVPGLVRVFGHCDQAERLNREAGLPRIEQRDLPLDQPCLFEVPDAPPAGRARHADNIGKFALIAIGISLQLG